MGPASLEDKTTTDELKVRRGAGHLFGGPKPSGAAFDLKALGPRPEKATLVDFFYHRFAKAVLSGRVPRDAPSASCGRQPEGEHMSVSRCEHLILLASLAQPWAFPQGKSQEVFPGKSWPPISSPGKAGWSTEKLAAARAYAAADSIHTSAVMIVQGGEVVDQWGDIDKKISSYSVRKSLLRLVVRDLLRGRRN